ncbi:MAG: C1 family peptidase [Elusimicrobiota bacterium]
MSELRTRRSARWFERGRRRTVPVLAAALLFLARGFDSHAAEIDGIRTAIARGGAKWAAEENPISRLAPEERKRRLGARPRRRSAAESVLSFPAAGSSSAAALPATLDWRNVNGLDYVTPVTDQGSCGSCWAFATTAGLESYVLRTQGTPGRSVDLSEQIVLSCSGAGSCGGGWPSLASAFLQSTGDGPETAYAYAGLDGNCALAANGWQKGADRIGGYSSVAQSAASLENALAAYGPVVATFNVYADFYSYSSGVYSYTGGGFEGGHAVLVVGYDHANKYFIVKNSWGGEWGENGFFRIAYSQMANAVDFGGELYAYTTAGAPTLSVAISNPANNAYVDGTISVSGTAADSGLDVVVTQVAIQVDGNPSVPAAGTANWSYQLNTRTLAGGPHTITATAFNSSGGTVQAAVVVTAGPPEPPVVTSVLVSTGTVGAAFSYAITASNNPTSFSAAGLPAGLRVDTSRGVISGTPTAAAAAAVVIGAANAAGAGSAALALTINPPPPAINSALNVGAQAGQAFHYTITATNSPTSFDAAGLPAGLSVGTGNGVISGTPAWVGTTTAVITAANAGGLSTAALVLSISPAAPVLPVFDQVSTGSIRFSWSQAGNPNGLAYVAQASTSADFGGTVLTQTGTATLASFPGLSSDASYYFRVGGKGGPFLAAGPQATLSAAPAVSTKSFTAVDATRLGLAWSCGGNQPDTLYKADVSAAPDFASGMTLSTQVAVPGAVFSGLTPNTPYYARVQSIGRLGGASAAVPLGSTTTFVTAPTLPDQPFSGRTTDGFTFSFNGAGDPAGTRYLVRVSTDPGFSAIAASSNTAGASAAFSGLLSNQLYYAGVAAIGRSGAASAFAVASTATAAGAPQANAAPVIAKTATTLGFQWNAGTLAPGTSFIAQVSNSPAFASGVTSSATANAFATFAGLRPNTTYYGRVAAEGLGVGPDGPFLPVAIGATLPNAPLASKSPFAWVAYTSATVAWSALPPAPVEAAAEGYVVQFSTAPDFTTVVAASAVPPGNASATVSGLASATSYFVRVGAVGWEGLANFLTLGGAPVLPPSSGTVSASGIRLTVPQAFSQVLSIDVLVPPGAFPAGTPISAVANLEALPAAVTNETSSLTPFGKNVGLVLTANGLQPAAPVTIQIAYDPAQIPPGQSESGLELWRYDPSALQWTLVPSYDDRVGHVLTAQTPHFSTFAPFFAAPGTDVSSVQVWPQPWEIGDASSRYWSSALNFSGLPAGASVKIFTILGELVWSGAADGGGVLAWDGNNRFGRKAASGTYYAAFQNGGRTKTRRLVIIR